MKINYFNLLYFCWFDASSKVFRVERVSIMYVLKYNPGFHPNRHCPMRYFVKHIIVRCGYMMFRRQRGVFCRNLMELTYNFDG
jgi:hypothetical protein